MSILALDLATTTGFASAYEGELVGSGVERFPPKPSHAARLDAFRTWVWGALVPLERHPNGLVIYETPFMHPRHRSGCLVGAGLEAMLLVECYRMDIPVRGVSPSALKKFATGKGNAPKVDVIVAAYERWPGVDIKDDNQADALMLLAMALDESTPDLEEADGR